MWARRMLGVLATIGVASVLPMVAVTTLATTAAGPAGAAVVLGSGLASVRELDTAAGDVVVAAGPGAAAGSRPRLELSTDGGATFIEHDIDVPPFGQGDPVTYDWSGLDFVSATDGWVGSVTEDGTVMLHTADAGATWSPHLVASTYGRPSVVVEPSPGTVLATAVNRRSDNATVGLRSTDGGASWGTFAFPDHGYATDLAFSSATVGVALVNASDASLSYTRIYRTDDAGATWDLVRSTLSTSGAASVAIGPSGLDIAYPVSSTSYAVSADGGDTWNVYPAVWDEGGHSHSLVIADAAFSGADLLLAGFDITCAEPLDDPYQEWAGGTDGRVLRVTAADRSAPIATTLAPGLGDAVYELAATGPFVAAGSDFGGWATVETSANGGVAWTRRLPAGVPGATASILDLKAWSATDVTATTAAGLLRTTDGGATWDFRYGPDGGPFASTMPDPLHGASQCQVTTDGGATWALTEFHSRGPMVSTLKGMRNLGPLAQRTIDGGLTWTDLGATGPVFALDTAKAWRVTSDGSGWDVSSSTNFGTTWSGPIGTVPLTNPPGRFEAPSSMRFTDALHGWIVTADDSSTWQGRSPQHLFRTVNGGTTWTKVAMPSGILTRYRFDTFGTTGVAFWEDGGAGTSPHLARSTDGGTTWTTTPLPAALATEGQVSQVDMASATTGYASGFTNSAGAFIIKTIDGGTTWSTVVGTLDTATKIDRPGWPIAVAATSLKGRVRITWDGTAFTGGAPIDAYRAGPFSDLGGCTGLFTDDGAACAMFVAPGGGAARSLDVSSAPLADIEWYVQAHTCLLYTSPSPRD